MFPEDFGNPWMANLEEIGLPDPVPWWPPAPGWYVVAALVVVGLIWMMVRLVRRWRANAYRRAALAELEVVEAELLLDPTAVGKLPALLKRVALTAYPRADVAALAGESWLAFLDGSLGTSDFSRGPGRLLPQLAYGPEAAVDDNQARALMALARHWIRRHRKVGS